MGEGRLAGRVALITGAADGIGFGMASRIAGEGAAVLVVDFNSEKGEAAAEALRAGGAKADFQRCDVTERDQVKRAVARAVELFGTVDILVNNAYGGEGFGRIEMNSDDRIERDLKMSLYAAKWSMEAAFPLMRERRWGRVINICSLNGVNAHMGSTAYNVGKEAMRAYSRTAAREWAPYGICVNIICPAAATSSFKHFSQLEPEMAARLTAANPMGRMGDPEADIGGVALFLASEDARYLTGNTLFADGGGHINGVAWAPDLGPDSQF